MRIRGMVTRAVTVIVAAAAMMLGPTPLPGGGAVAVPEASAAGCPDVEVIFARGRLESPGAGVIGNAFVSALRSRVHRNIGLYAVKYPADNQIDVGANETCEGSGATLVD